MPKVTIEELRELLPFLTEEDIKPLRRFLYGDLSIESAIQQSMRAPNLREVMQETPLRVLVNGEDINAIETGAEVFAGPSRATVLDFLGAAGHRDTYDRNIARINVGAGADCMFDVLVSTCFATLDGFTEGQTFTTLSGCTFVGYSTLYAAGVYLDTLGTNDDSTVFVCRGTYTLPATIPMTDDSTITVIGSGIDNTILKPGSGSGTVLAVGAQTAQNNLILIQHMTIDTTGMDANAVALDFGAANHFKVDHVRLNGNAASHIGITPASLASAGGSQITNCTFSGTGIGIAPTVDASHLVIANNDFEAGLAIGIRTDQGDEHISIIGNTINAAIGISITANTHEQLTIVGNTFTNCTDGIKVSGTSAGGEMESTVIANNIFYNCTDSIDLNSAAADIEGFTIVGNAFTAIGTDIGIRLSSTLVLNSVILGNSFKQYTSGNEISGMTSAQALTNNVQIVHNVTDSGATLPEYGVGHTSGGGPAAPYDAQFLTLATDTDLTNERVFTPRNNIYATDAGAGSTYTLDSWLEGATITPSAGTLTLGTDGDVFHVAAGDFSAIAAPTRQILAVLVFDGVSVLTHGANLILQGATNYTSAAGDISIFYYDGSSVWREVNRHTASAGGGHTIHDQDSAALTTRPALHAVGKGIGALDSSADTATYLIAGLYYDAIVDDTDHHGVDRSRTVSVTSITRSGATATVTTTENHGFIEDMAITIAGANESEYNGTFDILSHTDTTFTYTVTGTPASPATGTITATKKFPIYSTLQAAINDHVSSIFVHSASDVTDITIASTDAVTRIIGEATLLANIPVNVTCNKIGVVFEFLKFDSVRLKFGAARCTALGCLFTGTLTPPSALINNGAGITATGLSIAYDGGTAGNLLPTSGWGILTSDASGGGEPFSWTTGGNATSGTLTVGTVNRRGQWESVGVTHADNDTITSLSDGHLIVEGDDCTALTCQFISCVGPYTQALIQREGKRRMRVVSCVFLLNSTWSNIAIAPTSNANNDYGEHVISACVFDSQQTTATTYSCIDTFPPNTATDSNRACAVAVSINGNLFRDWSFAAIRQYGFMWNISGNIFEQGTLFARTFLINDAVTPGITAVQNTIPFDGAAGAFPAIGVIPYRGLLFCENELLSYIGRTTPFTNVGRGLNQTTAAAHGDNVTLTPVGNVGILVVGGNSIGFTSVAAGNLFQLCRYPVFAFDGNWNGVLATVPLMAIETSALNGGTCVLGGSFSLLCNSGNVSVNHQSRTGQTLFGHRGAVTQTNIPTGLYLGLGGGSSVGEVSGNVYPNGVIHAYGRAAGDEAKIGVPFTNRTGATSVVGNVVETDAANDNSVVNAGVGARSLHVGGVVLNAVANLSVVHVATEGIITVNCDTAVVARGDWLVTSLITAGLASAVAAPGVSTGFAIALTAKAAGANGSVKALLRNC